MKVIEAHTRKFNRKLVWKTLQTAIESDDRYKLHKAITFLLNFQL